MARLVSAAATSHAFALLDPANWDENRLRNQEGYARRFGQVPPEHPMVNQETNEDIQYRYANIRDGLDGIRESFKDAELDALLILGDDQNENFTEQTYVPQLAIYLGDEFKTLNRSAPGGGRTYRVHTDLGEHLYMSTVDAGFDTVGIHSLPDGILKSHAIGPVLERVDPNSEIRVIPLWIEGIHVPAPTPERCYRFGQALATAIESWPGDERVGVIASGGLSHFTAGYPYKHAPGVTYGDIAVEYDRSRVIDMLRKGRGEELASLTTRDLLDNGLIELRSWIAVAGMIRSAKTKNLVYEPFFRGIMGMGVAYWDLEKQSALKS